MLLVIMTFKINNNDKKVTKNEVKNNSTSDKIKKYFNCSDSSDPMDKWLKS